MRVRFSRWRLTFLAVSSTILVCILFYRIVQIQVLRHDFYAASAKKQWHRKAKWQARRGSILDRNGLPLAVTHRIYTIGVTPKDCPDNREAVEYLASVVGMKTAKIKRILSRDCRYVKLGEGISLDGEQEAVLSSFSGVKLDPESDRLNPLGSITPQFIGTINDSGSGTGGIELAFEEYLKGEDGWLLVNRDALDRSYVPLNAPGKKPKDGCDLYLTIDSRIQSIVDFELEQAVEKYGARGGAALVLDPRTGDILGIAEKSHDDGGGANGGYGGALYSTSCIYEPGSTFKLVTDAFLLERGAVDPYDAFDGEGGKAELDCGTFTDDHPRNWLTFKESFIYSNNICTIKAVMGSEERDFYNFIMRFGFGGRTGVSLPAESKGKLSDPSQWSARSMPSIAIGQEIGVTPLQLTMAYCALANGGVLLVPRVALCVRDGKGKPVKEFDPVSVRRVFSGKTAETLIEFCKDVVREGTGKNAAVDGIDVAGKTGTAQKAGVNGYYPDRHVASFIGFAPADDPRLISLVVLDEPAPAYHYGGSSSAVVFRKIIEGINMSTDLLDGGGRVYAVRHEEGDRTEVPNFLRLNGAEAMNLASSSGLRLKLSGGAGEVYAQVPGPGTLVKSGEEILLSFRKEGTDSEGKVRVPDLRGLSIRKARRMLLDCGLSSSIDGSGVVFRQTPAPGTLTRAGSRIELKCRPGRTGRRGDELAMSRGGAD